MFHILPYICLSFSAGALAHFSMAPYNLFPVLLIAFPVLYYALTKTNKTTSKFFYTWFFAFGYFLFGLSWIGNALYVPGNEDFLWAYPLALIGLPFLLAFFPAICVAGFTRKLDYTHLEGWFGFLFAYSLSEVIRGYFFTGFPWNSFGYTWFPIKEMAQLASIGGIYFLTILTLIWASTPALFIVYTSSSKMRTVTAIASLALLIISFVYGHHRISTQSLSSSSHVMVHVIQPNIAQHLKWDREQIYNHHLQLLNLTREAIKDYPDKTNLVIWPETATMVRYLMQSDIRQELMDILGSSPSNRLITGILRFSNKDGKQALFNSLSIFTPDLTVAGVYDKHHLVPFGEYIPFKEFIPLTPVVQFSGFQAGIGPFVLTAEPEEARILPLICYEAIFPQNIFSYDSQEPTLLVNVTNDGWYGNSAGPRQHLIQAAFRSIETGIPLVRSANTGISAIIDPLGRIVKELPLETQGYISIPLPQPLDSPTPYSNNRIVFLLGLLALLFILSHVLHRKK